MKKFRLNISISLLFSTLLFSTGFSQHSKAYEELDSYIAQAVDSFNVPGFAVGIIKNGNVILAKGYGVKNTDTDKLVDTETIFGIASCSKAFTAACLAILVDDGTLKWSDRVIEHYPEFQLYDPYITKEFRIDDLLSHRSGLITFDGDLLWYGSDYDRKEIVRRIRFRKNEHGFREKFGYQNVMYIAAGELIEKISGKTWDEFVQERIFEPLNMKSTSTTNSGFSDNINIAYPHIDREPLEFLNYDNCGPAASINTSVDDLLKWVELMINKGVYKNNTIFSEKEYYTLTSPHTIINAGPGEKINGTHFYSYGLGWFIYDYQGRKIVQHGGGLPGFHSKVVFIPEDSLGYVILANQLSGLVPAIDKKILDFFVLKPEYQDEAKDWASINLQGNKKQEERKKAKEKEKIESRISGTKPSFELKNYTGIYEDKMYGKAKITLKDDKLFFKMLPSAKMFQSELIHWHNDTFSFKLKDEFLPEGYLTFSMNGKNNPEYFTIELDNPDFHFYKLKFVKVE